MGYLSYELEEDEQLIRMLRKHWFFLALPVIKVLISLGLCCVLEKWIILLPYGQQLFFGIILALLGYIVYVVLVWYLDCYIITNKRLIDIDQRGLFSRTVAEIDLGNIQEILYEINGLHETLLGVGSVKIKITGSGSVVVLENIPKPDEIKKLISDIGFNINNKNV